MKEMIASTIGVTIGATIFAVICFMFDAPTVDHFLFASLVGGFTGLLAAPELAPDHFRHPKIFQVVSGIGVGLGIGLFFGASTVYTTVLCVIGAIIGYFAKHFIDAIHVP